MTNVLNLVGRILLALVFILSGISKLGSYTTTVAYMESKGIPIAPLFFYLAVLLEILCGFSVATGFRARIGALVLFVFLIPVTLLFHFKGAFDGALNVIDRKQLIEVLKNMSIMGGLVMVYANGAGKFTIGKDK